MTWEYVSAVLVGLPYVILAVTTVLTISVAAGLSRGLFRQTMSSWSWRSILSLTRVSNADRRFLSSLQAEELVEQALLEAGWRHVFLRRRVHVHRLGHNREIDVVAVGPVVLVVEVKHWQGDVWSNGPRWFQKPKQSKRAIEFEDILDDNMVKAAALRRYIENDQRIPLPDHDMLSNPQSSEIDAMGVPREQGTWYTDRRVHKMCGECVVPIVVFTNRAVVLDPNTVRRKSGVFDLPSFKHYARQVLRGNGSPPSSSFFGGIVQRMTSFFGISQKTTLTSEMQSRIARAVDIIRTWDMVYLHNGRLLSGDVTEVNLPSIRRTFERKHLLDVNIQWFYGVGGFLRSIWKGNAATVSVRLGSAYRVAMQKNELSFPILNRNLRHVSLNDRLVVKLAGTKDIEVIPLADIREVRLSHHLQQ